MTTNVSLTHKGICSFAFEDENKVKVTYTFEDSDDMFQIGMSLIKNSLLSKLMVEKEQIEDDPEEIIREFVDQISEEISNDETFSNEIEEIINNCCELELEDDSDDNNNNE